MYFRTPGLILRGADPSLTTIYCPQSLAEIYGQQFSEGGNQRTSDFSHKEAFITFARCSSG